MEKNEFLWIFPCDNPLPQETKFLIIFKIIVYESKLEQLMTKTKVKEKGMILKPGRRSLSSPKALILP